jgi:hypothetical protein
MVKIEEELFRNWKMEDRRVAARALFFLPRYAGVIEKIVKEIMMKNRNIACILHDRIAVIDRKIGEDRK